MLSLQHETIMQCAPWRHVCIKCLPTYISIRMSVACLLHFQPMHNTSTGICWQGTMTNRSRSPRCNPLVGHGVGNDIPMDAQLGQFLKKQFLLNKLPANTIQEIALLAQQGGAHHMRGLSKLGNNGNACKNISRDLMRASIQNISVPTPYMVTIPITLPKTKLAALVEHPVLLPSEILAWMLCNGKFSLKEIVNMQEAQPVMHNRLQDKCKKFHLPETSTIPIGLHGDGVPFQKIHSQALHN